MIKLKSLLEATKIRGANNKMVEVPKSYNDKTGKFAYRFYRTPGMGGDLIIICPRSPLHHLPRHISRNVLLAKIKE